MQRSVLRLTSRLLFVPLGCLFSCAFSAQADPLRVTVVLSEEGGAYQAFNGALRSKLLGPDFVLTTQRADETPNVPDLYIAVGLKAASKLASSAVPTLSVLVPKAGYDRLQRPDPQHASSHSVIYLDQPLERQVALLLAALPDTRQVGVLYSAAPPELQRVRRLFADRHVNLHYRAVDGAHPLNDVLESLLHESDALFALADADIYNASTIRNILLTTYRQKVPLVGISQAFVKAGALCAVFTMPEQFAEQTAIVTQEFAESGELPPAQYPSDFEVLVNTQVARSLELQIKDAGHLRDEIRRAR